MKAYTFASRNFKEIIRDPLTIIFSIGFPAVLLILLSAIQANIPIELFKPERLTPGITVFGLAFLTLFSATLISKDRESAFLQRLFTTPMKSFDYIIGYIIPLIPLAVMQGGICYILSMLLGLEVTIRIIPALLSLALISIMFISLGLLFGSILTTKQVGGICGALLTNLTAWLSGIWFDISLVGKGFESVAKALPFLHSVELERAILIGSDEGVLTNIIVISAYTLVLIVLSVAVFRKKMAKL